MDSVIAVDHVWAGYGSRPVLRDVSLHVDPGEIVAILGPNGAGKSTLLKVIGGELKPQRGRVLWQMQPARGPLHARVKRGLAYVPEDRSVIMGLSLRDNLRLGRGTIKRAIELFPALEPLLGIRAGSLSGGEQQMLTLARALASDPAALAVDELSLGLAPVAVARLLSALRATADGGTAILLVEQGARLALSVADRAYVLGLGAVVTTGRAVDLLANLAELETVYFGQGALAQDS